MPSPNYTPEIFSVYDSVTTPGNDDSRFATKTDEPEVPVNTPSTSATETLSKTEKKTRKQFALLTDIRWRIVLGVIFIIIAAFLFVAVLSYFFTAPDDQSELDGVSLEQLVENSGNQIKNLGGPGGALAAHRIVTHGLGLGALPLLAYIIIVGLMLLGYRKCNFWSTTFKSLLLAVTLSIVFGLICFNSEQVVPLGGYQGYYMNYLIMQRFAWPGAIGVSLLLLACVTAVYFYDILKIYRRIKKSWDARMERRRAAEEDRRRKIQAMDELLGNSGNTVTNNGETDAETQESSNTEDIIDVLNNPEEEDGFIREESTVEPTQEDANSHEIQEKDEKSSIEEENTENYQDKETYGEDSSTEKAEEERSADKTQTPSNGSEDKEKEFTINEGAEIIAAKKIDVRKLDPTSELPHYKMPSTDLLHEPGETKESIDVAEIEDKKNQIIEALSKYGIGISKIEATVGPTVTMYEIVPAEGVKIATIKRLEEDIAMALAALSTRIIAPIPGKSAIGIEVPNREKQIVSIHTILGSKAFQESKYELPIALGATIDNEVYIADLAKMPHLLVAGATGKGKSVGMNVIINSLLYKKHPAELKFVLVDPKMVEFHPYRKLENHYLAQVPEADNAIITDTSKVIDTLKSLCVEMDERYKLLQKAEVVKITHYNDLYINKKLHPIDGHRFLPYIVVIVDEYADLVMTAGKEIETPIARLAQKARAVGMHVIIATQRPSANIITGIIKANFPARIAFKTSSPIDSKIILENTGAHQLIGNGDMLVSQDGELKRVQCAFISTDEIKDVAQYIADQQGFGGPFMLPDPPASGDKDSMGVGTGMSGDWDPLLDDVARAVVNSGVASTSNVQRNFQIGFNRAGRVMDQLCTLKIVGPPQGSKPREILVDTYRLEEILQEKNNS